MVTNESAIRPDNPCRINESRASSNGMKWLRTRRRKHNPVNELQTIRKMKGEGYPLMGLSTRDRPTKLRG
jgi:hypothetical protein